MNVDRRNFFKLTGIIGAAAGISTALSACGKGEGTASTKPAGSGDATPGGTMAPSGGAVAKDGTITAGISYELGTNGYDPMTTTSALTVAANWHTMEGLTEIDPASRECYAALGKELPKKVDDTTYEVTLREGAKFHDGTDVTADDVVYSFERVLDPANKSLYASFITFLDKVEKKDEKTVLLKLKHTFSLVAERVAVVKIVPKALASADQKKFDLNPVGTGPYKMTDNGAASQKVLFERFDGYTGSRPALAKKMEWQILPDGTTRTNALTSGTVQAIDAVGAADLPNFKAPNEVGAVQGFGLIFAMFNCASAAMKDVRNRQAIMYALDYAAICEKGMSGLATPATSFLHKDHPSYKEAKVVYKKDAEKAKALLAETGLTEVRVLCTDHGWFSAVRPIIKENIEALGLKVTYEEKKSSDVYGTIDSNPDAFDVVFAPGDPSVFGDDADLLLRWWYAGDVWTEQRMHWKGSESYAKVQDLLTKASSVTGEEQKAAWHEIFDVISEEVPLYPLLHRKTPTAFNAETLVGFKPIALTGLSFQGVGSTK
ncbi:ABC transporter substrate-binding protein [Tessaracoccus sp. OH4464_COT-324]|uniref:ABC transporter substrate-binding protein n=1 Tax=Tessaracoccus sp. OH4464_COT-324 TaxID=2491059 RepID=UPI000F642FD3|nr:ABC transporter substrate-binding protein [Tessaracoccus sp. OH4464_COT-324]RRD46365.1 ABC transporter substrate-binding protein [Tessaracoccus sp. OH4464_COT-324]